MLRGGTPTAGGGGRPGRHGTSLRPLARPPPPGKSCSPSGSSWRRRPCVDFIPARLAPLGYAWPAPKGPKPPPRPALPHLRFPLPRLRRRPRALREPSTPSSPPAVSWRRTTRSSLQRFTGPPHYFGQNKDAPTLEKNQAELKRRRDAGFCFKCRKSDVQEVPVPFLECPLQGTLASPSADPPTVGQTHRGSVTGWTAPHSRPRPHGRGAGGGRRRFDGCPNCRSQGGGAGRPIERS